MWQLFNRAQELGAIFNPCYFIRHHRLTLLRVLKKPLWFFLPYPPVKPVQLRNLAFQLLCRLSNRSEQRIFSMTHTHPNLKQRILFRAFLLAPAVWEMLVLEFA